MESEAHARKILSEVDGITEDDIERLLRKKISKKRLEKYKEDDLRQIAIRYLQWDPLVRIIENNEADVYSKFAELKQRLVNELERNWGEVGGFGVEDAMSNIFLSMIVFPKTLKLSEETRPETDDSPSP